MFKYLFALIIAIFLTACGGGGGGSSSSSTIADKLAYLIDSPVYGLHYKTQSREGTTLNDGSFKYTPSDINVTFKAGSLTIGVINIADINSDSKIFLQDLVGVPRDDINNTKVLKIASLLLSLDTLANPNIITLQEADLIKFTENKTIDEINVSRQLSFVPRPLFDEVIVKTHLCDTINLYNANSCTYIPPNSVPLSYSQSVETNQSIALDINLTGTDADNDPLTYIIVTNPSHGSLSGTVPNILYTPTAGYYGNDSFTYKVNDVLADSNISTISITISQVQALSSTPMLGILLSYNNISVSSSETVWSDKLFGKNEHQLNHYYQEVSNLKFEFAKITESYGIANDGIVSVSLNKSHPNTDINDANFATNMYPDLKNALIATDSVIDFSTYDTNSDAHITPDELLLTFIIAGYEDSYEGSHVNNGVWAHQYCMTDNANTPTLDGKTLMGCLDGGNFALFGEKHDTGDTHDATIGIIAHELGHAAFGLPDLYNTINPNSGGIGYFGLMGSGAWGALNTEYAGNTPVHLTAWSKTYNGWVVPNSNNGLITLNETPSNSYNVAKINIDATSYYLIENRNNSGYDRGLYRLAGTFDGGLAIWKVDETKLTSQHLLDNDVNADTNNKAVDLVEAVEGTIDSNADRGNENALYYQGNIDSFLSPTITNISQRGSSMSLNIQ